MTHSNSKSNTDFKQIPLSVTNNVAIKRDTKILTNNLLQEMVEQFAYEANELISFFQGTTPVLSQTPPY